MDFDEIDDFDSDASNDEHYYSDTSNDEHNYSIDKANDNAVSGHKDSSFEVLSTEQILKLMDEYIEDVVAVFELPPTTARFLLFHTNWNKQKLSEQLTDGKLEKYTGNTKAVSVSCRETLQCSVCVGQFPESEILVLRCGHEFCKNCCCDYLTFEIAKGKTGSIGCLAQNCADIFDESSIIQLVSDEKVSHKYPRLVVNKFVELNHSFRFCPSLDCTFPIRCKSLGDRQKCTCFCGHTFCFGCGDESHDPIPCTLLKEWKKNDNDSTAEYLFTKTKFCPNCYSLIAHEGGCNHIFCPACSHQFCWICYGNWCDHNTLDCSDYRSFGGSERWFHYLLRFAFHKQSDAKEKEEINDASIGKKFSNLRNVHNESYKSQYLEAVGTLHECRKQIMLMCIFGYHVQESNKKSIFQMTLSQLESDIDKLSLSLANDLKTDAAARIMQNINDEASLCKRVVDLLNDLIYEIFKEQCDLGILMNLNLN